MNIDMSAVSEGEGLPSALGKFPLPLVVLPSSSFLITEGVVKGEFCCSLPKGLGNALGKEFEWESDLAGQFSVTTSVGLA
ncbi:hypothetical protein ES703_94897 [subsurface metagenome]